MRKAIDSLLEIDGEIVTDIVTENTKIANNQVKSEIANTSASKLNDRKRLTKEVTVRLLDKELNKFLQSLFRIGTKLLRINEEYHKDLSRFSDQNSPEFERIKEKFQIENNKVIKFFLFRIRKFVELCIDYFNGEQQPENALNPDIQVIYIDFITSLIVQANKLSDDHEDYSSLINSLEPEIAEKMRRSLSEKMKQLEKIAY